MAQSTGDALKQDLVLTGCAQSDQQISVLLQSDSSAEMAKQAMDLYNMRCESYTHLRQPVRLETQLLKLKTMDAEVGQSMLQLLQASIWF